MALQGKVKTALDETRLLILGSQVLLGFQLNGMFQEAFVELSSTARTLGACAYVLMAICVALLITPSMQHRLVEQGYDSMRLQRAATQFAALALLPFSLSLGLDFFLTLERHAGAVVAASVGIAFFILAILCWFGIERFLGRAEVPMTSTKTESTPLHARVEQMLTEVRVLLPGAQAMLGFQFAILLTKTFEQLPQSSKIIHVVALMLVAVAMILLMTPAAIHRISYGGEDSESFHAIGSALILAAAIPLGLGIAADIYVGVARAMDSSSIGLAAATGMLIVFSLLWFIQPLLLRGRR
jgi:hypothetical protein